MEYNFEGNVFDNHKKPVEFKVKDIIGAWKELVLEMKNGGKVFMVVPPHRGYGDYDLNDIPPNSILVLTYGRERASELRDQIVIQSGANAFEPIVRTFHSLAFSIINTQVDADDPKYVLISGAEQDSFIRELLANPEHSPQVKWPKVLEPALSTKEFAWELRDLILRASERNFTYKQLIEKGHLLNEPWWEPAANFWKIYDEILGIRYGFIAGAAKRIDSSSIISQAISDLSKKAKIRESFQNKFKVIVISNSLARFLNIKKYELYFPDIDFKFWNKNKKH